MASGRGRTAALYNIFYGEELIEPSLESVYEAVDHIYIVWSDLPMAPGADSRPDAVMERIERFRAQSDRAGKLKLLHANCTGLPTAMENETAKYNWALAAMLSEGPLEFIVNVDADEVFDQGALQGMLEVCRRYQGPARQFLAPFQIYFGFLNYVIDPPVEVNYPEEACPVIARPGPGFRFVYGRHAARESQVLVRGFPRLHHFSYVRQDDRAILGKLMSFGHHDEVGQGWFKDKYLAWKADHAVGDLHPVIPGGYQGTRRVEFSELPQAVQRALPRLRREYPGMFEPEVD